MQTLWTIGQAALIWFHNVCKIDYLKTYAEESATVLQAKSDSDVIFCFQRIRTWNQ